MAQSTATSSQGRSRSAQSATSTRSGSNTSNYRERLQALVENQQEGQRILQSLGGRLTGTALTPTQVREASVSELQRQPSLWEAYIRGWQACIASMPTPPALRLPNNTWPTPRPIQPAAIQRTPCCQPRSTPVPSSGPRVPTPSVIQTPKSTAGPQTTSAAKRRSMARLAEHRRKKQQDMRRRFRESQANTSQQFRLEKPVGLDSTPAPPEESWNPVHRPVPAPRTILPAVEQVPMEVEDQGAEQGKEEDALEKEISNFLDQDQN